MFSPGVRLDKVYRRIGDRGTVFFIFCIGFIVHTIFALQMEMLSIDPNEFGVAAWAALFGGKNWSGVMSRIGYFYGYAGAIIYTPVMLLVKNPFIQYKVMLILNGFIVSFVPVLAYRITRYLGVEKAWNRTLISVACGLYSTSFAHTKFIWNETSCVIFPWLLIYLIIRTSEVKNKAAKHLMSALTAFTAIVAFAAHPRLLGILVAVVITVLFARIITKKRLVCLTSFIPSLIIFAFLEYLLKEYLTGIMWGDNTVLLQNTVQSGLHNFLGFTIDGGILRYVQTFFGHLYYLAVSTWGLGALAFCLVFVIIASWFKARRKNNVPFKYNNGFVLFGIFAFSANLLALFISVTGKFNTTGFEQFQDTAIFGRYMDGVIPLLIMLVLSYVFIYGLDLTKLLGSIIILSFIYCGFFIFTSTVIVNAVRTRVSPILGIYPIRIGQSIDAVITLDGLFLTVSSVFCFVALFIVFVCCAKRYRAHIISICMVCIMLYSSLYTAIIYLPFAANEAKTINEPVYEISESIYNSADAPSVYAYRIPRKTYSLLQFLNQDTLIISVSEITELSENCFILVPNSERLILRPDSTQIFRELARTAEYTLYAYGERAAAFAQSQEGVE